MSDKSTAPHTRRRVVPIVIGALALLLLLGVVTVINPSIRPEWLGGPGDGSDDGDRATTASSGVLGDADGDKKVSKTEKVDLDKTESAVKVLDESVFAAKGVQTRLVTPAGPEWWKLATSVAYNLKSWTAPVPQGATWYAVTEGRAYKASAPGLFTYQALHVRFPSVEAAQTWYRDNAAAGIGETQVLYRGDLATIVPNWVQPDAEPFKDVADLGDIEVPIGMWQIDMGEWITQRAAEVPDPGAYVKMWSDLGFAGEGVTWSATSTTPEGPWVGPLAGFQPNLLSASDALGHLSEAAAKCPQKEGSQACGPFDAMGQSVFEAYVNGRGERGAGVDSWKTDKAPVNADVYLGMSPSFQGLVSGQGGYVYPPLNLLAFWVTGGDEMTVYPDLS